MICVAEAEEGGTRQSRPAERQAAEGPRWWKPINYKKLNKRELMFSYRGSRVVCAAAASSVCHPASLMVVVPAWQVSPFARMVERALPACSYLSAVWCL
jgi:hypothetical protein